MSGSRGPVRGLNLGPDAPVDLAVVTDETAAALAPPSAPAKPEHLTDEMSELWDRIVPQLDETGLISPGDGMAIEAMLMHFSVMRRAYDEIMDSDALAIDDRGDSIKKHPADVMLRQHSDYLLKYANVLGATFMSRARTPMKKEGSGGTARNPFAAAS